MRDIYEKCQKIVITPGFKVNSAGESTETHIDAKICGISKEGGHSYAQINVFGKNLEEAEKKLEIYINSWLDASNKI